MDIFAKTGREVQEEARIKNRAEIKKSCPVILKQLKTIESSLPGYNPLPNDVISLIFDYYTDEKDIVYRIFERERQNSEEKPAQRHKCTIL